MNAPDAWIVFGTSGEYSDRREWPVCVLPSEKLARTYVDALSRQYETIPQSWKEDYWETETQNLIKEHMTLDPNFDADYTGTSWFVGSAAQLTEHELLEIIAKAESAQ